MPEKILGVLASGRGSNLKAIIDAIDAGNLKAKIGTVISDNPDAAALSYALDRGIPAACIDRRQYGGKEAFEQAILDVLSESRVDLVVLAGFMRILSSHFIKSFPNRIMNIHPSLLPSFPGTNAQKQALDRGVKVAGCTVHFVDEGVDSGPIIMQKSVPVLENDTEFSLSNRILRIEHMAYPAAIDLYCAGLMEIKDGKVRILHRGLKRSNS